MDRDDKDLDTAFKSFKEHYDFMFGGPLKAKSEEEKCNYQMLWASEKVRSIYSSWKLTYEQKKSILGHYKKLKAIVNQNQTRCSQDTFSNQEFRNQKNLSNNL